MNAKVSIIVPVYKIEQYVGKCVDSIISQSYRNLEIILVDDGSPDSCGEICDKYQQRDDRIIVIHKSNGGLSDARNAGLDIAKGEYITFIDGDDWYAHDAIDVLVKLIQSSNAQIACMLNTIVDTNHPAMNCISDDMKTEVMNSKEFLRRLCSKSVSTSVCNKLFKASLWKDHRFLKGRLNEDYLALGEILMDDLLVATINYTGYYYFVREESLTHLPLDRIHPVLDALRNAMELKKKAELVQPDVVADFARMALYQARTLLFLIKDKDKTNKGLFNELRICLSECKPFIKASTLRYSDKLLLNIASISINAASLLAKNTYSLKVILNGTKK